MPKGNREIQKALGEKECEPLGGEIENLRLITTSSAMLLTVLQRTSNDSKHNESCDLSQQEICANI